MTTQEATMKKTASELTRERLGMPPVTDAEKRFYKKYVAEGPAACVRPSTMPKDRYTPGYAKRTLA
jgi:hypothetical protein